MAPVSISTEEKVAELKRIIGRLAAETTPSPSACDAKANIADARLQIAHLPPTEI